MSYLSKQKEIRTPSSYIRIGIFLLLFLNFIPETNAYSTTPPLPFNTNDNVKIEITYSVNYTSYSSLDSIFKIWIPRLNTWESNETEGNFIQESELVELDEPASYFNYTYDPNDVYNNTYDYYAGILNPTDNQTVFSYSSIYNVSLFARGWTIPEDLALSDYNTTSELYQFYTNSTPYYDLEDTEIQNVISQLVGSSTNIKEILENIYLYVVDSMNYTILSETHTVKEIIGNFVGDCSEFSTLMVGLLRAAGIPARKVLGIGLIDGNLENPIPRYDMKIGDTWSYQYEGENQIPGHAWVQYYIPSFGWLSADPTWGQSFSSYGREAKLYYLYNMDQIHLITTVGDWYEEGIVPPIDTLSDTTSGLPEFPFVYPIGNSRLYNFQFEIDFNVLNSTQSSDFNILPENFLLYVLASSPFLIIGAVIIVFIRKRSQSKKNMYY